MKETIKELNKYDARHFIDPAKMAERKEITDARVEGYIKGQVHGYRRGITQGIGAMVLLIILINTIERIAG